jgi:tRNA 2-selenouridine synthase
MPNYCNVLEFHRSIPDIPVIDVRSPSEFSSGHIPGSHNIPILDDDQRAAVGTFYKQKGRLEAIELGFELAGPHLAGMIRAARELARNGRLQLYCWRGGMRSRNMAWLLETNGIRCRVLEGGYKAYRQFGKALFLSGQYRTWVLGGFTGSNKTAVLHALAAMGEQVLDIEKEARHRGSSFGMIGQLPQRTNEQFENELIRKWLSFDESKRIWIEDESKILGSNHIPEPLYLRIRNAPVLKLELDRAKRAANLVEVYGGLDDHELEQAIRRIERKLGGQLMQQALEALKRKDYQWVAEISLNYYDKTYEYGLSRRDVRTITRVVPESTDPKTIAHQLLKTIEKLERK